MSSAEPGEMSPHVVLIGDRSCDAADTRQHATADVREQIAGGMPATRANIAIQAKIFPTSAEHASEVVELPDADAGENDTFRFLNSYDCPCGESWSSEDDVTCDDRCPKCRTSCSPTRSEDA